MCALESQIHVLDGGFSTQLHKHVSEPIDGTPLWSASFLHTNPNAVINTHLDFLRDTHKVLIAGAVGPYGTSLHDCSEYTGNYVEHVSPKEMVDWHRPRIRALVEAGADILAFETIPAQSEAEALAELLKEFPEQKAWLSFSCKDEVHTSHGENFQHVARRCWEINPSQLVAVGVNCVSPKYVSSLLMGINKDRQHSPIPLIVYPNSGESYDQEKGWTDSDKCCPIENYVEEWLNLGVTYIGGCCRIYAADIVRIKEKVNKWRPETKSTESNWSV